jgi:hypothetical protein
MGAIYGLKGTTANLFKKISLIISLNKALLLYLKHFLFAAQVFYLLIPKSI